MKKWKPVDIVVLILVITISLVMLAIIVKTLLKGDLSEDKSKMFAGLVGSVIAIISIYVGSMVSRNNKNKRDE